VFDLIKDKSCIEKIKERFAIGVIPPLRQLYGATLLLLCEKRSSSQLPPSRARKSVLSMTDGAIYFVTPAVRQWLHGGNGVSGQAPTRF